MQKTMEAETLEKENNGLRVKINGSNELLELDISDELIKDKQRLISTIKDTLKDATKDMQRRMAKKMMGQDIDFDALKKLGM